MTHVRSNSLSRALTLAATLLVAAVGCQESSESPSTSPGEPAAPALGTTAAPVLSFRQVSAGGEHTCGTTTDDRAYCWGDGRPAPVAVSSGLRFLEVNAGVSTNCGITIDQRLYCWGHDLIPAEVPGGRRFRQVSVGDHHICAVNPFDVAFCWGENTFGQLGTGGAFTRAGAGSQTLKQSDATAIQGVSHVTAVTPIVSGSHSIIFGVQNETTQVQGVYPSYTTISSWNLSQGSMFTDDDETSGSSVAVIGQSVVDALFTPSGIDPVGQ